MRVCVSKCAHISIFISRDLLLGRGHRCRKVCTLEKAKVIYILAYILDELVGFFSLTNKIDSDTCRYDVDTRRLLVSRKRHEIEKSFCRNMLKNLVFNRKEFGTE